MPSHNIAAANGAVCSFRVAAVWLGLNFV